MELNENEIGCIGTFDSCLEEHTNLKRIFKDMDTYFDCMNYEFKVTGYKRYVPFYGKIVKGYFENDQIKKYMNGNGFFPTYMCQEGLFVFSGVDHAKKHAENMQIKFKDYLDVTWLDQRTLQVKLKDPMKYLIEFDFPPHNFGPNISIVGRVEK